MNRAASDGLGAPAAARGGLLEGCNLRAQHKALTAEDGFHGGHDFRTHLGILPREIEDGDRGRSGRRGRLSRRGNVMHRGHQRSLEHFPCCCVAFESCYVQLFLTE